MAQVKRHSVRYLGPDAEDPSRVLSIAGRYQWHTPRAWGWYMRLQWWNPLKLDFGKLPIGV